MDNMVHQLLTRLNMFLMQELDFQVDVLRYAVEAEYAAQVLDLAMETGHHEIRQLARQIRERQLQLFSLNVAQAAPQKSASSSPPPNAGSSNGGLPKMT